MNYLGLVQTYFKPVCVNPLCDKSSPRWHKH